VGPAQDYGSAMLTWIRSHAGMLAVFGVVLAVAMASSATAAHKITGKNIKNGSVTTKDIKDGNLAAGDLSAAARASLQGQPGASFIGSACTVPGHAAGTVSMQVDVNGVITLQCSAPPVSGLDIDSDADGYKRSLECNDTKPAVNPAATELNGDKFDNDCDTHADDGLDTSDTDGDGQTIQQGDCDDTDATTAHGNPDTLGNGLDNNCDGVDGVAV
jgi:hypothetical protein